VDLSSKHAEFEQLKARVERLEQELAEVETPRWQPGGYYPAYRATAGFVLGIAGAATALLVNVIGAPIAGKHPLELIRVYLTFPLGEKALALSDPALGSQTVSDGMVLAFGCCLYLATGMLLGIPFNLVLSRLGDDASLPKRLIVASAFAIAVWLINFYLILSWLQPLLFGGNWIVDSHYLPWWVAAVTHLIFGWTMALVQPWGRIGTPVPLSEKS
jgi:hypothetical protein